eukprot:CAMPEP_0172927432 /NCGR_PEP_ID=MMETSP1075-20121228/217452_1 /TAXON_ID=2916 /ORGANISM="Ceratium fusus, Strain PA161109" /LENGTH=139 /DNA_ID=CAMNT_0013788685 /DNA_START=1018 /DNA_END=1437 /DNA_ORIENTATION=+
MKKVFPRPTCIFMLHPTSHFEILYAGPTPFHPRQVSLKGLCPSSFGMNLAALTACTTVRTEMCPQEKYGESLLHCVHAVFGDEIVPPPAYLSSTGAEEACEQFQRIGFPPVLTLGSVARNLSWKVEVRCSTESTGVNAD